LELGAVLTDPAEFASWSLPVYQVVENGHPGLFQLGNRKAWFSISSRFRAVRNRSETAIHPWIA
jgi:hypothetical protein